MKEIQWATRTFWLWLRTSSRTRWVEFCWRATTGRFDRSWRTSSSRRNWGIRRWRLSKAASTRTLSFSRWRRRTRSRLEWWRKRATTCPCWSPASIPDKLDKSCIKLLFCVVTEFSRVFVLRGCMEKCVCMNIAFIYPSILFIYILLRDVQLWKNLLLRTQKNARAIYTTAFSTNRTVEGGSSGGIILFTSELNAPRKCRII